MIYYRHLWRKPYNWVKLLLRTHVIIPQLNISGQSPSLLYVTLLSLSLGLWKMNRTIADILCWPPSWGPPRSSEMLAKESEVFKPGENWAHRSLLHLLLTCLALCENQGVRRRCLLLPQWQYTYLIIRTSKTCLISWTACDMGSTGWVLLVWAMAVKYADHHVPQKKQP